MLVLLLNYVPVLNTFLGKETKKSYKVLKILELN